jgi:hypothetical protein
MALDQILGERWPQIEAAGSGVHDAAVLLGVGAWLALTPSVGLTEGAARFDIGEQM